MNEKLTGNIHEDIQTVYNAIDYVESLADGLIQEEIAQNNDNRKRMPIYLEMLSMHDNLRKALEYANKTKNAEERYMLGPLAGRKDMPF